MVTVEGVARRIDPDNDIWAAARPVVERWIARELSPAARVRELFATGQKALDGLARLADAPQQTTVVIKPAGGRLALAAAILAGVIAAAALAVALG
jgi:ubiquinone biosynthesis protein